MNDIFTAIFTTYSAATIAKFGGYIKLSINDCLINGGLTVAEAEKRIVKMDSYLSSTLRNVEQFGENTPSGKMLLETAKMQGYRIEIFTKYIKAIA